MKPHLKKQWCIGRITSEYLARMEDILALYERPYDERFPVVCFDERPCQLLDEVIMPLPMQAGQVRKVDYEYKRCGTCCLLLALEAHRAWRYAEVPLKRKKVDFAAFMQRLSAFYPKARKIIVVLDNLNTHNATAFYEAFAAATAFDLSQCFEFHYTPKKASWLNMVEIELSAISKQCLDRRIATRDFLSTEVQHLVKERNEAHVSVNWQFTNLNARQKLQRHYQKINPKN